MQDISGQGLSLRITASNTFPSGFNVTQFADDADPFDMPTIQLGDDGMGLNGDMPFWSTANAIPVTINVIPGSEDDINLSVLAEANRVGRNKTGARDQVTLVASFADGKTLTFDPGYIREAMRGFSVASAGRKKSKSYVFRFENMIEA